MMVDIFQVLFDIEKCRQLYIGDADIWALHFFLCGYHVSLQQNQIEYNAGSMLAFDEYVHTMYQEKRCISAIRCVVEHTNSKEEAFEEYFKLLHRFVESCANQRKEGNGDLRFL